MTPEELQTMMDADIASGKYTPEPSNIITDLTIGSNRNIVPTPEELQAMMDADIASGKYAPKPADFGAEVAKRSGFGTDLSSGLLNAGVGLFGDLPDLTMQALSYPSRKLYEMVSGNVTTLDPTFGPALRKGLDTVTGVPGSTELNPKSLAYQLGNYGGGFLVPGGGAKSLGLAALAGSGAYLGQEVGGDAGEMIGGILAPLSAPGVIGLARAASSAIGPQTKAGVIRKVGEALDGQIDVNSLERAISKLPKDGLSQFRTTAEVAKSSSLSVLEDALAATENAAEFGKLKELRIKAQNAKLNAASPIIDAALTNTGDIVKDSVGKKRTASLENIKDLYSQIPGSKTLPKAEARAAIKLLRKEEFANVPFKLEAKGQLAIDRLLEKPDILTGKMPAGFGLRADPPRPKVDERISVHELYVLKSAISEASKSTKGREARFFGRLNKSLDDMLTKAPEGQEWKAANEATKKHHARFGKELTEHGDSTGPLHNLQKTEVSDVFAKVMSKPEALKHLQKMVRDDPEVFLALKSQVRTSLESMTDDKKFKYLTKHKEQLRGIFGKDYAPLEAVRRDLRSLRNKVARSNIVNNSKTATRQGPLLEKAITGKNSARPQGFLANAGKGFGPWGAMAAGYYFGSPGLALGLAVAKTGYSTLANRSYAKVGEALFEATMSPSKAIEAIKTFRKNKQVPLLKMVGEVFKASTRSAALANMEEFSEAMSNLQKDKNVSSTDKSTILKAVDTAMRDLSKKKPTTPEAKPANKPAEFASISKVKFPAPSKYVDFLKPAVLQQESGGNMLAVSPKGAQGLYQIMPNTAKEIAAELGIKKYDMHDPVMNEKFYGHYMNKLLGMFGDDPELALAAYNAGPGRVRTWQSRYGKNWEDISKALKEKKIFTETVKYVPGVLNRITKV